MHCIQGPVPRTTMTSSVPGCPFERIAVDLIGPLTETGHGNKHIMVVSDYFTTWSEAYAIPNQEAVTVAKKLVEEFVLKLGLPRSTHSDQGQHFESTLFREMCNLLQMNKTRTTIRLFNG